MKRLFTLILTVLSLTVIGQININFEVDDLTGWTQKPTGRWQASTASPLAGARSLKHTFNNNTSTTDSIYYPLPTWDVTTGDVTWRMLIRYGNDPSTSNSWWVYLMSDGATITTPGTGSGYAVGVNLTGSDDLLKIWRVTNGTPQIILTSTLNWQTQIGTGKAGAIEVQRLANGTFTLKASVNGIFTDLVNYGSVEDINHTAFENFGILYRYTSSADMLLWADNISITYDAANLNDNTTNILNPTAQIAGGTISSLANNPLSTVDVFRFAIQDMGSGDNLPTRVKRITFSNPSPTLSPWSSIIGGIKITGPSGNINIKNAQITNESIILDVDSTQMVISDGAKDEFTLGIYLKNGITEGTSLSFEIDQNHGFFAGISGSGFVKPIAAKATSNNFTIQVQATHLRFTQQPIAVGLNKNFSVSVSGCDEFGSIDNDFAQPVTLSLNEGNGNLTSTSGLTKAGASGTAQWTDLVYSTTGTFSIKTESGGLIEAISNDIQTVNDTTSTASEPTSQPVDANIQSLKTSPEKAVEIMRLKINDIGSGDNAPTIVKSIKLSRTSITNIATLNKAIEGVLVKRNGALITLADVQIKSSAIEIFFGEQSLVVADGTSAEISIWAYLKSKDLTDGQVIQLYVDKNAHGFTAYEQGSGFSTQLATNITSNIFTIKVDAAKLSFKEIPARVGVLENFTAKIAATDKNENIDKDFSGEVRLKLASGNGTLAIAGGETANIVNGEVTYNGVNYSIPEKFSLLAQSTTLDDVASAFITCGDNNGVAVPITVSEDTITVSSANSSSSNAFEVLKLRIKDKGTSDGLPLIPNTITLATFDPDNAIQLSQMIKGFAIITPNGAITPSFSVSNGKFVLSIAENSITIPNNDSLDITIKAFIRENAIVDGTKFRFYIPTSNHGLQSATSGTAFSTTIPLTIYGQPCKIDVVATNLTFAQVPFIGLPNQAFSVRASATDSLGNSDNNFTGSASLLLQSGNGQMETSPMITPINNGMAIWSGVKLNSIGKYQFKATSETLMQGISPEMYVGYNQICPINEDFEGTTPSWNGIQNWKLSTITPISGVQSLIHAGNPDSKVNTLTFPIGIASSSGKAIEWEVTIRNGNWDPSSDNYFYFVAASTSEDLDTATGIAIGINPSSGNDFLSLWAFEDSKRNNLIVAAFDWNENDEVKIKLTLSPTGKLSLWYQPKQSGCMILGGETNLKADLTVNYGGLEFGFTSSRAGLLWVDNLKICAVEYPPLLKSVKSMNLSSVKVQFSKSINPTSASNISNYAIKKESGESIEVQLAQFNAEKPNEVLLTTSRMPLGNLQLNISNILDENGYAISDSATFGIGTEGNLGQLVITEIMANPIPSVGLPEYEYVELYNPYYDSVSITGWKMQFNSTTVSLPAAKIAPQSYAVVCSNTASEYLSVYGKAIGVTSFPSLLNDGMLIKLFDSNSNLIAFANYTNSWYNDATRNSGGYSMECVDITNLAEGSNNWKASQDTQGGTPCAPNSVTGENPDVTKPRVVATGVMDDRTIKLTYNEPMDSLSFTLNDNYALPSAVGIPNIVSSGNLFNEITITLANPMEANQKYTLTVSNDVMDFAGNRIDEVDIDFALPQTPLANDIVINEVLFNPYTGGTDFVELYNNSDKTFDLKKIYLSSRNSNTLELNETYPASDTARLFFPNEYVVICTNPALVMQFYTAENPRVIVWASKMASFNNDKGYVVLLDEQLEVVDEFYYSEKMHSKLIADVKGVSLERISPNLNTNDASTWQSASQVVGFATPTYKNSQYTDATTSSSNFTLSPETFSPDGDGRDDYLLINYNLPDAGYVANIRVYTSSGVEVYRLANNLLLGTEGSIRWDGINFSNRRVPVGIYIIYIEYFNLNGEVKKEKKVCVVASRS
ncbi:MAG: lamin tail domain-containing protein [Bacteroidales bacterium]|nr:lamin tail domain-containing protein [Bacteroidales bacterium]